MWTMFFLAVLVGLLSLYLPGYLQARAFLTRMPSLAVAPLIALAEMNLVALVYAKFGVFCSWASVTVPLALVGVALIVVRRFLIPGACFPLSWGIDEIAVVAGRKVRHFGALCLAFYVVFASIVAVYVIILNLESPDSFVQEYDNVNHLGLIRNHAESGIWSPFANTQYFGAGDATPFVSEGGGFYPSSWIMVASLVSQAMSVSPALAENAANFVFVGFVFPISVCVLLRVVFDSKPEIVACGALCVPAFAAFPWRLLLFGPLYPNVAAYALVPAVVFAFISMLRCGERRSSRILAAAICIIGIATLTLTQPNAVFTVALFLIPYCTYRLYSFGGKLDLGQRNKRIAKVGLAAGFVVFSVAVWAILLHLPFFQAVLTEWWPAYVTKQQALIDVTTLSFAADAAQPVLSFVLVVGVFFALLRREYLWLAASFGLFCFMFWCDASTEWDLKLWLTGFWYTDKFRIAAAAAMFGIPLAAMGLYLILTMVSRVANRVSRKGDRLGPAAVSLCFMVVFALAVFFPSFTLTGKGLVTTAFGKLGDDFEKETSSATPSVYDADEREFVEKVKQITPQDSIVLNLPHDGSAFACAQDGLNVYYRYCRGYDTDNEKPESSLIRNSLCDLGSNAEVREAVEETGAEYVLLLDVGGQDEDSPFLFTYEEPDWSGISSINDGTSGLEILLSDGDMRLYRITGSNR